MSPLAFAIDLPGHQAPGSPYSEAQRETQPPEHHILEHVQNRLSGRPLVTRRVIELA